MYFSGAMSVLAVVALGGLLLDDRVLLGPPIWLKPFKFAVSFILCARTGACLLSLLRGRRRTRIGGQAGTVIVGASANEIVAIVGEVIRGRPSHFNVSTPLDAVV